MSIRSLFSFLSLAGLLACDGTPTETPATGTPAPATETPEPTEDPSCTVGTRDGCAADEHCVHGSRTNPEDSGFCVLEGGNDIGDTCGFQGGCLAGLACVTAFGQTGGEIGGVCVEYCWSDGPACTDTAATCVPIDDGALGLCER